MLTLAIFSRQIFTLVDKKQLNVFFEGAISLITASTTLSYLDI